MGRRTLEPGQYVQTGQTISYLVRNKDKWITANYKETQIANIYIGQQVRIKSGRSARKDFPWRSHRYFRKRQVPNIHWFLRITPPEIL